MAERSQYALLASITTLDELANPANDRELQRRFHAAGGESTSYLGWLFLLKGAIHRLDGSPCPRCGDTKRLGHEGLPDEVCPDCEGK